MIVKSYKTHKIKVGEDLYQILDKYLPKLEEKSIVVITSKVISLCQGDIVKNDGSIDKKVLIIKEADWFYIDKNLKSFGVLIPTIKDNILIANAGIDESNADGDFVLWPKNLTETIDKIWKYLKEKNNIKNVGVIITDSVVLPLRYGSVGMGILWCGFEAQKDYRGKKDIFKKELKMSQLNILDGLSATAVTVMGEGSEQTPLATVTDIPFVVFQNNPPTYKEINNMLIKREEDVYGKMLTSVKWEKGGSGK